MKKELATARKTVFLISPMNNTIEKTVGEIKGELIQAIAKACETKTALKSAVELATKELPEFAANEQARANVKRLQSALSRIGRCTARRVAYLSNARLCNAWNSLTNPHKMRTEKQHKLANEAAKIAMAEITKRGFRTREFSNGAIFPV